jgi:hypothetical protein
MNLMKFDILMFIKKKNCLEKSSFIKIRHEQQVLYMKANIHFVVMSRTVFLRMRNFSDKGSRENQNTHFMLNNLFSKIVPFMR